MDDLEEKIRGEVTQLLGRIDAGEAAAQADLMELVYQELQRVAGGFMRRERPDHTLQPTALVNEAVLRMLGPDALGQLNSRAHLFGAMAQAMRRVLVDHARAKNAQRRGGERERVGLDLAIELADVGDAVDMLAIDEALRKLESLNARQAQVVELRFFGGLSVPEIAEFLGISVSTVEKDWRLARAWLSGQLQP